MRYHDGMATVRDLKGWWDVPASLRETPFQTLLEFHNFGRPLQRFDAPTLAILACMDARVRFRVPEGFATELRAPGAALAPLRFGLAYAVATKGVRHVAVVAHRACGATGLSDRRTEVVAGLRRAGVDAIVASALFDDDSELYAIDDPVGAALSTVERVEHVFPRVRAAAFLFDLERDGLLSLVER